MPVVPHATAFHVALVGVAPQGAAVPTQIVALSVAVVYELNVHGPAAIEMPEAGAVGATGAVAGPVYAAWVWSRANKFTDPSGLEPAAYAAGTPLVPSCRPRNVLTDVFTAKLVLVSVAEL